MATRCCATRAGSTASSAAGATTTTPRRRSGDAPSTPTPTTATSTSPADVAPQTPFLLPDRATLRRGVPLLIVEGVLDAHLLRARDEPNVAALGGTALTAAMLARLGALGTRQIILAFDNDPAGYDALRRAIDTAVTVPNGPAPFVLDPDLLDDAKDPGELIARHGAARWRLAAAVPVCGVEWRALDLLGPVADGDVLAERAGVECSGAWLSSLPGSHAVARRCAARQVAEVLGCLAADVDLQISTCSLRTTAEVDVGVA